MITAAQFLRVVGALVRLNFSTGKDRACVRAHLRRCLYTVDSLKRLTHTVTHTRKRADGSSGNMDAKEYFDSSGNGQKRLENNIFRIFLLFVISRSGVRIHLPPPVKSLEITWFQGFLLTCRTQFCTHFGIWNRIAEIESAETWHDLWCQLNYR